MYLKMQKRLLVLFSTMVDALCHLQSHPDTATEYILQLQQVGSLLGPVIKKEGLAALQADLVRMLSQVKHLLYGEWDDGEWMPLTNELLCTVKELHDGIKKINVRLKVFFLPYKAEMWTALESIWFAFRDDPMCDAYVMPIPYTTLKFDGDEILPDRFCYEAAKLPANIPLVHYQNVDIAAEEPDAVFIHNPYDDANNLTRVPEQYYSQNLCNITDMLVYSPYYTVSGHDPQVVNPLFLMPAMEHAHQIVTQSQKLADIYQSYGIDPQRLLICGSPKMDALVNGLKNEDCIPAEWRRKLQGKTVFLMNVHLGFLMFHKPEVAKFRMADIRDVISRIRENPDYALIWRPHPLLLDMLRSRGQAGLLLQLGELMQEVEKADNMVLDRLPDYLPAFIASDAMISCYSSMVTEYMVTGKPTIFLDARFVEWGPHSNKPLCVNGPVPLDHNYFPSDFEPAFQVYSESFEHDWTSYMQTYLHAYGEFMKMVHRGEDPKRHRRIGDIQAGFECIDGTSGKMIHKKITELLNQR